MARASARARVSPNWFLTIFCGRAKLHSYSKELVSIPRQTLWSQERKDEGRCVSCGAPRRTYTSLCDECMSKKRNTKFSASIPTKFGQQSSATVKRCWGLPPLPRNLSSLCIKKGKPHDLHSLDSLRGRKSNSPACQAWTATGTTSLCSPWSVSYRSPCPKVAKEEMASNLLFFPSSDSVPCPEVHGLSLDDVLILAGGFGLGPAEFRLLESLYRQLGAEHRVPTQKKVLTMLVPTSYHYDKR